MKKGVHRQTKETVMMASVRHARRSRRDSVFSFVRFLRDLIDATALVATDAADDLADPRFTAGATFSTVDRPRPLSSVRERVPLVVKVVSLLGVSAPSRLLMGVRSSSLSSSEFVLLLSHFV